MKMGFGIMRLEGRCADKEERDGGKLFHYVENENSFGIALCGVKPGRSSGGFVSVADTDVATCKRCLRAFELRARKLASSVVQKLTQI